jgi:hypothetical protein
MRNQKYHLVLCQQYQPEIHGHDNKSSQDIHSHYICHHVYRNNLNSINELAFKRKSLRHSFYKHYQMDGLQIAQVVYLNNQGNECVAILKTFWIKIFLRICIPFLRNIIQKQKRMRNIHYLNARMIGATLHQ